MRLGVIRDIGLKWKAARLHGAAVGADANGDYEKACTLATQTLDNLDRCAVQDFPDAIAIRLTSVVLLDRALSKLGKAAPVTALEKALQLALPFGGAREFDERIEWMLQRLAELKGEVPRH
jgi:hypothetical protein